MRAPILSVLFLTACSNFTNEVYWVELTEDPDGDDSTISVEHNFIEARPIEAEPAVIDEGNPVTTVTRETSPEGFYVHVRRGADGVVFVNFLERVLTGSVDAGVLGADWDDFDSQTVTTTFDSLYRGDSTENTSLTWTLTLRESDSFGGTFDVIVAETREYSETDEWDTSATSVFGSAIPASTWLESASTDPYSPTTVANRPDTTDCAMSPCSLTVIVSGRQRYTVDAFPAGPGGYEYFDAVQGFGQTVTLD